MGITLSLQPAALQTLAQCATLSSLLGKKPTNTSTALSEQGFVRPTVLTASDQESFLKTCPVRYAARTLII